MIPKFWAIPISLYIKDNPDNSKSSVVTISSWYIVYSLKNISSTFNLSLVPVLLKSWISERCLYNAIENDSSKVKPRKVKDYILYSIWIIMLFLNMHKYYIYIYYTCYNILYVNSSSWIQEFQNSKHQTNQVRQAIDCSPWTSSTIVQQEVGPAPPSKRYSYGMIRTCCQYTFCIFGDIWSRKIRKNTI